MGTAAPPDHAVVSAEDGESAAETLRGEAGASDIQIEVSQTPLIDSLPGMVGPAEPGAPAAHQAADADRGSGSMHPASSMLGAAGTAAAHHESRPNTAAPAEYVDPKEHARVMKELEDLRVANPQNMTQNVNVMIGNESTKCQFLYLTNAQASSIGLQNMRRVSEALGISGIKQVIRIMPSRKAVPGDENAFPFQHGRYPTKNVPEIDEHDESNSEHQLILLSKEHLLPLAVQTHALVTGMEGCALMDAFRKVSAPIQRQMGDKCPFRLLIFARALYCHMQSREPGTVSHHIRNKCRAWEKSDSNLEKAIKGRFGDDEAWWPRQDLYTGVYSMVMFEGLNIDHHGDAKLALEVVDTFKNDFIASYSKYPVIALQLYGQDKIGLAKTMRDHVEQGLQLLLIDSRDRKRYQVKSDGRVDIKQSLERFASRLNSVDEKAEPGHEVGRMDAYDTAVIAYVKSELDRRCADSDHSLIACPQKRMWLWEAIYRKNQNQPGGVDGKNDNIDRRKKELIETTDLVVSYCGKQIQWERDTRWEHCEQAMREIGAAGSWDEFRATLDKNWLKIRGCCFHKYRKAEQFAREHCAWIEFKDHGRPTLEGRKQLKIRPNLDAEALDQRPAQQALLDMIRADFEFVKGLDKKLSEEVFMADEERWLAVYELMKSVNVKTGNMFELGKINDVLQEMAQTDRLPRENTLETLVLLRRAWTLADVYESNAKYYKWVTKLSYFTMLALGIAMVTITVLTTRRSPEMFSTAKDALLILALSGSLITGLTTIFDPNRKWLQLRGAELTLVSEIWKFRTRVGDYANTSTMSLGRTAEERRAEQLFRMLVITVQEKVQQSSGLKETNFYAVPTVTDDVTDDPNIRLQIDTEADPLKTGSSRNMSGRPRTASSLLGTPLTPWRSTFAVYGARLRRSHYKHQQYASDLDASIARLNASTTAAKEDDCASAGSEGERPMQDEDNFHSPARPEDYIRHRLMPAVQFYQGRIPQYARRRRIFQGLLLILTVASAFLAAVSLPSLTAIVAAVSSSIAAWQEFSGLTKKLERYSTLTTALENLLTWWQSLSPVEQQGKSNQEQLVQRCETLLNSDHSTWMSDTQQASKMMMEAAEKLQQGASQEEVLE